jgi:hypothetical protein
MDASDLQSKLEESGELMLAVDGFEEPIEIHLHDTDISETVVTVDLADGELQFELDAVAGSWKHLHTLEDLGLGEDH